MTGPSSTAATDPCTVAGVLLAAGDGRRLGQPKALVRLGGQLLVDRGAEVLADAGCRPVLVVLGAAMAEVRAGAVLAGAAIVENADWQEGMGSSVRAGLQAAERHAAAAAVMLPVDQPLVDPALVVRLIDAWRRGAAAAIAAFGGVGRTPVLLDRSLWPAVLEHAVGDVGARNLLRSRPEIGVLVDCDDVGESWDVDTPEDLRTLERRYDAWRARRPDGHPQAVPGRPPAGG